MRRFFDRTYITGSLLDLASQVVRRLSGIQVETSAVFNMATQFGGGKSHSLLALYQSELAHFQSDAAAAKKLATDPLGLAPEGMSEAELAAWTVVANVVLNLDGVMMKG